MNIVGCDFHPKWQQVAVFDTATGEISEHQLMNRKLAVRLYWMLRQKVGYPEIAHIESSPRVPLAGTNKAEGLVGRSRTPH